MQNETQTPGHSPLSILPRGVGNSKRQVILPDNHFGIADSGRECIFRNLWANQSSVNRVYAGYG